MSKKKNIKLKDLVNEKIGGVVGISLSVVLHHYIITILIYLI